MKKLLLIILLSMMPLCAASIKNIDNSLMGSILKISDNTLTIQDSNHIIYTFNIKTRNLKVGDLVNLKYVGTLDKNTEIQNNKIKKCEKVNIYHEDPIYFLDNGIFAEYYEKAYQTMTELTLDERIGQLLLVRFPKEEAISSIMEYKLGGFVLYEKDFKDKNADEIRTMIKTLNEHSKIPLLIAVDEEGGKVTRISKNPLLTLEPFKSPSELYQSGGFDLIRKDTILKSSVLSNLGINLNLAPVVDISNNSLDYIYERTLKENSNLTGIYAKTVIETSKLCSVSYTLKHFPGYGSNQDTHQNLSIDHTSYQDILNTHLYPFIMGVQAGAEAVMVNHNIVTNIDNKNPASLSASAHNLLRNYVQFSGIIITDDLDMNGVKNTENLVLKAILAGNDLLITTDFKRVINEIHLALDNHLISEDVINKLAFRILAWKYYKGLIY